MTVAAARSIAERLVDRLSVTSPPVDVDRLATELGLGVIRTDLGSEVSGLLVTNAQCTYVCVHEGHHKNRQRFTIAHEIGHFVLRHQFETGAHVHVDRGNFISQRGPRASAGVDLKEIEANQFAASLLMPSKLVREKALAIGGPLLDQDVVTLARMFVVSEQAMTIRLTTLGLL
jgi:Zn-dependent peptidase ImmA (M78 family)